MRSRSVVFLVAAAVVALAACDRGDGGGGGAGGGKDRGTGQRSAGGAISRREFIARADRICARAERREKALGTPPSTAGQSASARGIKYFAGIVEADKEAIAHLKKLPRPPGDEAILDRYFELLERRHDATVLALRAARAQDPATAQRAFEDVARARTQLVEIAKAYGFKVEDGCGLPGATSGI